MTAYQQLAANSSQALGVQLPEFEHATLTLASWQGDITAVRQAVAELAPESGWAMWRDELSLDPLAAEQWQRNDLLQAQFCRAGRSLHIQHLQGALYQISQFDTAAAEPEPTHGYSVQALQLRGALVQQSGLQKQQAVYRLWYRQQDHLWLPVGQQFIGFSKEQHHG